MLERLDSNNLICFSYEFASVSTLESWNLNSSNFWPVSTFNYNREKQSCQDGGFLYFRTGSLLKSNSSSTIYLAGNSGNIYPFENEGAFWRLGFDYQQIFHLSQSEFESGFQYGGSMIEESSQEQCFDFTLINRECGFDDVIQSYSGSEETNNIGQCQPEISVCQDFHWVLTQEQVLASQEIFDNVDNDCDGQTDEDFENVTIDDQSNQSDNLLSCTIICPVGYTVHIWYGSSGNLSQFERLVFDISFEELCQRGRPWVDYNCANADWSDFDYALASIECNNLFESGQGRIDYRGEGEIWFETINCFN